VGSKNIEFATNLKVVENVNLKIISRKVPQIIITIIPAF
jgi:hypothetical protein